MSHTKGASESHQKSKVHWNTETVQSISCAPRRNYFLRIQRTNPLVQVRRLPHRRVADSLVEVAESLREQLKELPGENHESLDERREHDERQRNPDQRVHDAEDLASLRQRSHVTVTCTSRDGVKMDK